MKPKSGQNTKWQKIAKTGLAKTAMSVAQYFNSCRSILDPNENFLETEMISERSSTNPISLTLFGDGH
jgi:hypothetical protein